MTTNHVKRCNCERTTTKLLRDSNTSQM